MEISTVFTDIAYTLSRVMVTTVIAWSASIGLAVIMHKFKIIYHLLLPLINFLRQISPFVWLPLVIIIFGLGELPIGIVLFAAMLFPGIIMTFEAIDNFPKDIYEEAVTSGAHSFQLLLQIELPILWNNFINIFRLMWSVGWSTVIAAEMLGVKQGLGFRLLDFRYLLEYQNMIIYILIIGVIGIVSDMAIRKLFRLTF